MISALSGNFKRELFKPITKIIPKCEFITILKAFCGVCKDEEADFSLRTIRNDNEIYIGGAEMYKPVCRKCYFSQTADKIEKNDQIEEVKMFKQCKKENTKN